jgi:hypothetical protein
MNARERAAQSYNYKKRTYNHGADKRSIKSSGTDSPSPSLINVSSPHTVPLQQSHVIYPAAQLLLNLPCPSPLALAPAAPGEQRSRATSQHPSGRLRLAGFGWSSG